MSIGFHKVEFEALNPQGTYDPVVDVTDFVIAGRVGNISESIDSGEYDIGLYLYSDLNIQLSNYTGLFSSDKFSSSMFPYTRDRARVTVTFVKDSSSIIFKGIINDEATKENFLDGTVNIKVLSQDSILRKTKVSGGVITDNMLVSQAIANILNLPSITGILGFDALKISVGIDLTIDDASVFSDKSTKEVLGELLNASGSIFRIDSDNDMVVSPRTVNAVGKLELFANDVLGRDNIIDLNNYNDGLQRSFNVITVNGVTSTDENYVSEKGAQIKEFSFDFITDLSKAGLIADYMLSEFKEPKRELEVAVSVELGSGVQILDPVSIDFSKQHIGWDGERNPLYGTAVYGSDKYPFAGGGFKISPSVNWKVTGIRKNTSRFETVLRLREI